MTATTDAMALWFWPLEAAQMTMRLLETAVATQSVLAQRLPMLSDAVCNPAAADRRELSLMVSEKVDAFGRAQRSVARTGVTARKTAQRNAEAMSDLAAGGFVGAAAWTAIFERNMALAAALMTLPMQALAPVHAAVTANARRLQG